MPTPMERLTISLPEDIAKALDELKRTRFYNVPKSKAIHHLLRLGMEAENESPAPTKQSEGGQER